MKKIKILNTLNTTRFGKYFTVKEYLVESGNGTEHFFMKEATDFSIIIPFLDKETLVLARQYRFGADRDSLEFPMGVVEEAEPIEAARIELKQETGYSADVIEHIGSFFPSSSSSTQRAHVFIAHQLRKGEQELEITEDIEVELTKYKDFLTMVQRGEIIDGPTLSALSLYLTKFGNNAENMR